MEPCLPGVRVHQARLLPSFLPLNFALSPSLPLPGLPLPPLLASRLQSKLVVNFSPAVVREPFQVKYYSQRWEPAGQRLAWRAGRGWVEASARPAAFKDPPVVSVRQLVGVGQRAPKPNPIPDPSSLHPAL